MRGSHDDVRLSSVFQCSGITSHWRQTLTRNRLADHENDQCVIGLSEEALLATIVFAATSLLSSAPRDRADAGP